MRVHFWIFVAIAGLVLAAVTTGPAYNMAYNIGKVSPAVQAQQAAVTLHVRDVGTGSPEGTCGLGGQVVMRISIEGAQDLSALQFELHFDQDVATIPAGGVSSGADIPGGWLFVPNPNVPGRLVIGMVGTTPPNVDGFTIADVTFDCDGSPGQATNLTFSNIVAGNVNEVGFQTESVGGSITIAAPETIAPPDVDVSVEATVDSDPVMPGNNLTYTVTVTNQSASDTARSVTLTDSFPQGTTFVSSTPGEPTCTQSGGTVTCGLGDLAAGQSTQVIIVVTVGATATPGAILTNQAGVTVANGDPNTSNNAATVSTTVGPAQLGQADLSLVKAGRPNPVNSGSALAYTVTVTNNGPGGATNVTMTDTLPAGVILESVTATQGTCSQSAGTVVCNLGSLASGATAAATIRVTVDVGTQGTITNTANVAGDQSDTAGNNAAAETTTVLSTVVGGGTGGGAGGSGAGGGITGTSPAVPAPPGTVITGAKAQVSAERPTVIQTADRRVTVSIPAQALPASLQGESVEIEVTPLDTGSVPQPRGEISLVRVIEINTLVNGQATQVTFEAEVELSFSLDQVDLDRVDGNTSRLVVLRFDSTTNAWAPIEAAYDPEPAPTGRLVARLKSFSLYAVGARAEVTPSTPVPAGTEPPEPSATPTPAASPTPSPAALTSRPAPAASTGAPAVLSTETPVPSPAAGATAIPASVPNPAAGATPIPASTAVSGLGEVATPAPAATPVPAAVAGAEEAPGGAALPIGFIIVIVLAVAAGFVAGGAFMWMRLTDSSKEQSLRARLR